MKLKSLLSSLFFFATVLYSFAQNKADDVIGVWLTPGDNSAKIEIYRSGEKFSGKIVWMRYPNENGKPKTDSHNPDKNKQNNPRLGLVIIKGFKFDGDDEWKNGSIYDPESGKTYRAYMYLKDNNTLKLRGYIGFSFLGRTETWSRSE